MLSSKIGLSGICVAQLLLLITVTKNGPTSMIPQGKYQLYKGTHKEVCIVGYGGRSVCVIGLVGAVYGSTPLFY